MFFKKREEEWLIQKILQGLEQHGLNWIKLDKTQQAETAGDHENLI